MDLLYYNNLNWIQLVYNKSALILSFSYLLSKISIKNEIGFHRLTIESCWPIHILVIIISLDSITDSVTRLSVL